MVARLIPMALGKLGLKWYEGLCLLALVLLLGLSYLQGQRLDAQGELLDLTRDSLLETQRVQGIQKDLHQINQEVTDRYHQTVTQNRRTQGEDIAQMVSRYLDALKPPQVQPPFRDPTVAYPVTLPSDPIEAPLASLPLKETPHEPPSSPVVLDQDSERERLESLVAGMQRAYCGATRHGVGCPPG